MRYGILTKEITKLGAERDTLKEENTQAFIMLNDEKNKSFELGKALHQTKKKVIKNTVIGTSIGVIVGTIFGILIVK